MRIITLEAVQKKFEIAGISVDVKETDENFFLIDGISLYYDEYDSEYKGNKVKRYGWIVAYELPVSGGHWEPDDVDFIEDSQYNSINPAIGRICALLIEQKLQNYDESTIEYD